MGENDFTYELPKNFHRRVVQFLQQSGMHNIADAFQRCKYEYDDVGLAFYAGLKGDNWNKKALDFNFEGLGVDISLLKSTKHLLKDAIGKSLRSSESGYLIRDIYFFETDMCIESIMIPLSNENRLNADIETANVVCDDLIQIGERVCLNPSFNSSSSENSINDSFRDMLVIKGYSEVKDQTRHGISINGKDAGEVDILLTKEGKEIAIFEGLKIDSVNKAYIDIHINKAIINYNALGTATFIISYVNTVDFESFWERYAEYLKYYEFPIQTKNKFNVLPYPNAATRIATIILSRDGYDFPVYFIAFKIS